MTEITTTTTPAAGGSTPPALPPPPTAEAFAALGNELDDAEERIHALKDERDSALAALDAAESCWRDVDFAFDLLLQRLWEVDPTVAGGREVDRLRRKLRYLRDELRSD
jgi:hypothetical protein